MKSVRYKKHWSYKSPAMKAQGSLTDFVLDIMYLMNRGVIPPLHVLNEVLKTGGNSGGMGPGTTWSPFKITREEYGELVDALLSLNVEEARKNHPYLYADKIIKDEELNECPTYLTWLRKIAETYAEQTKG